METFDAARVTLSIPELLPLASLGSVVDHVIQLAGPGLMDGVKTAFTLTAGSDHRIIWYRPLLRMLVNLAIAAPITRVLVTVATTAVNISGVLTAGQPWGEPTSQGYTLKQLRGGVDVMGKVDAQISPIWKVTETGERTLTQQQLLYDMVSPAKGDTIEFEADYWNWFEHKTWTNSQFMITSVLTMVVSPLWDHSSVQLTQEPSCVIGAPRS